MSPLEQDQNGRKYWRSLNELSDTPEFREFLEREFPAGATDLLSETTRRGFLKVMGASLALAGIGVTSCRWPTEKILPYSYRPEGVVDGEANYYATAMELGGSATGLLVTSYDGRPVKIEGNPSHPASLGSCGAHHLAAILEMYDPDRSQYPQNREGTGGQAHKTADEFVGFATRHFPLLRQQGGTGLAILSEATSSPSLAAMRQRFAQAFPQARWYEYEPISDDDAREGSRLAFGQPFRTHYDFTQATVIFGADSDFLGVGPNQVRYNRDYAKRRLPNGRPMNRHYQAEGVMTITGGSADHRLPVRHSQVAGILSALATELGALGVYTGVSVPAGGTDGLPENWQQFVSAAARDLADARGSSIIAVGGGQAPEVHALAHALNAALGNHGRTITFTADADPARPSHAEALRTLTTEMGAGGVETLIILGGNPAFNAPRDLDFATLLGKVKTSIHLSLYNDETSRACTWHLPRTHFLESWGDARGWDGTLSVVQPLIAPLYASWTPLELLSLITEPSPRGAYELVRETLRPQLAAAGDFEDRWSIALNKGLIDNSAWPTSAPGVNTAALAPAFAALSTAAPAAGEIELELREDYSVFDGRFTNNGWLQEMPDPISKLTWDNALYIGVKTASELGLTSGQLVNIEANGRSLECAMQIVPGIAPGQGVIGLGYGRTATGKVGNKTGFDSYNLVTSTAPRVTRAKVTGTGGKYKLATVQDHFAIDLVGLRERNKRVGTLVREITLEEFERNPNATQEADQHHAMISLWNEPQNFEGHKWGMTIDLNLCTGCSACIVACVSENNIPVVGKKQVAKGREMHWIRVDRYYRGDVENPTVLTQPVTCHHCENAPCEQVCPVAATVHSEEGLNQMVYNRCIGTRYCSNNCPYKVRKFNYFAYNRKISQVQKMGMNPEVTVRSRGVMEKCTFCVQRIQNVKIRARNEGRAIADGEITPACAQACPTQAIVFGDLNNPGSRIAREFTSGRSYGLLREINTQPRLHYLSRIRNVDAVLAPAHAADGEEAHG